MRFDIKGFSALTLLCILAMDVIWLKSAEQPSEKPKLTVSWPTIKCTLQVCSSCGHHSNVPFRSLGATQLGPVYRGSCGDGCCYAHAQPKCSFVERSKGCHHQLPGSCSCSDDSDTESICFSSSGDEAAGDEAAQMLNAEVCRCCFARIMRLEK